MMRENFEFALGKVLAEEGGWTDDPRDPGGATNFGITQATYSAYLGRPATKDQLRHIPRGHLEIIYKSQYWDKVNGDALPRGVDLAVFDFAVNSGPGRAAQYLQELVGVTSDRVIGYKTIEAVKAMDPIELIEEYTNRRLAYLKVIKHRKTGALLWPTFGRGWTNRLNRIARYSKSLALGKMAKPEVAEPTPKAPPEIKTTAKPGATGKIIAGAGAAGQVATEAVEKLTPFSDLPYVKELCLGLTLIGVGLVVYRLVTERET